MILPYIRPTLVVAGLFRLIDSIKAFPLIYVLTNGGPGTATEVTNYYAFVQAFNFSLLGLCQRDRDPDGGRRLPAELADRPPRLERAMHA